MALSKIGKNFTISANFLASVMVQRFLFWNFFFNVHPVTKV